MELYPTLIELLKVARTRDREIRFIDGENDESVLTFADLWDQAIAFAGLVAGSRHAAW